MGSYFGAETSAIEANKEVVEVILMIATSPLTAAVLRLSSVTWL
jgi:hypothetical protein